MKDKKNIIIGVLVILLILAIAACLFVIVIKKKTDNGAIENSGNNQNNTINENNQNDVNQETKPDVNKQKIDAVYAKLPDANWLSKRDMSKSGIFIKDAKIYSNVSDNNATRSVEIPFTYGNPKYVFGVIGGGALSEIIVVTESGEAYSAQVSRYDASENLAWEIEEGKKLTFDKVNFSAKVVDVITYDPIHWQIYFLLENGDLVTKENKTYEEINKNHIAVIGGLGLRVYVCDDGTVDSERTDGNYIKVLDSQGKQVKIKKIFNENTTRYEGTSHDHFYVIDENDNLLHFSDTTLMVAGVYYEAEGKKVSDISYDSRISTIKVLFKDGTYITMKDVGIVYDFQNKKEIR
ncbi:MAG: hypothetical protein PHP54_05110 [Clostridia bacterium]|nr:hypothetical protein [Clostridia bacterium]